MAEERVTVEVNDDEDFEEIEGAEIEENEGVSELTAEEQLDIIMQKCVSTSVQKANAYTNKRINKVKEKLSEHQEILDNHAGRIEGLERVIEGMATGKIQSVAMDGGKDAEKPKREGILDNTLGTIGDVAHGVVDTAAFLCEAVIDLATLGKARRQ